jgi:hypothetical protein
MGKSFFAIILFAHALGNGSVVGEICEKSEVINSAQQKAPTVISGLFYY